MLAPLLALLAACPAARLSVEPPPERPRYRLELTPDLQLLTFEARLDLAFANPSNEPLTQVPLHLYPNAAATDAATVAIREVRQGDDPVEHSLEGSRMLVTLSEPVPPGQAVRLQVLFDGVLPRMKPGETDLLTQSLEQLGDMFGGLLGVESTHAPGDYGILAYGDGILSFGNWYPQLPAWSDEGWLLADNAPIGDIGFSEASDYELTVIAPADLTVAASGTLDREETKEGRVRRVYLAPRARSVAVQMSRDYQRSTTMQGEVEVNSYYLDQHAEAGELTLRVAADALDFYSRSFGSYAWDELDVVEAPLKGGAGGVEFTGLVTCSTSLYGDLFGELQPWLDLLQGLGGSDASNLGQGLEETLEFVVAHEVAHQWWNAAVGSDSRQAPFLDEALANFSAVRYFAARHGADAAARQRQMQLEMTYQAYRMMGGRDLPVAAPARDFPDQLAYAAIVYGKGALFFETLVDQFGEAEVLSALARYYEKGRHGVQGPEDLKRELAAMEDVPSEQVVALWDRWLLQTHGDEDIGTDPLGGLMAGNPLGDLLSQGGLGELLGGSGSPEEMEDLMENLEDSMDLLMQLLGEDGSALGGQP